MADETPKTSGPLGLPEGSVRAIITLMLVGILVYDGAMMVLDPAKYANVEMGGVFGMLLAFAMAQVNAYNTIRTNGK